MSKHDTPARHQWYEGHPCILPPARTDSDAASQAPDNYFANTQINLRERSHLPASRLSIDRHPDDAHRTGFAAGIQTARDITKRLREQNGYDAGNAMLLDRLDAAIRDTNAERDPQDSFFSDMRVNTADPPPEIHARNAGLDAATWAQAAAASWQAGPDIPTQRKRRLTDLADRAAQHTRQAAELMEQAIRIAAGGVE